MTNKPTNFFLPIAVLLCGLGSIEAAELTLRPEITHMDGTPVPYVGDSRVLTQGVRYRMNVYATDNAYDGLGEVHAGLPAIVMDADLSSFTQGPEFTTKKVVNGGYNGVYIVTTHKRPENVSGTPGNPPRWGVWGVGKRQEVLALTIEFVALRPPAFSYWNWDGDTLDMTMFSVGGTGSGLYPTDSKAWDTNTALNYPKSFRTANIASQSKLRVKVGHPGDANLDGCTDFADFLILSSNYETYGNWEQGDFDHNGYIDFADFLILSSAIDTCE